MPSDPLADATAFLHGQIPITRAMGVVVESRDGAGLTLTAPLAANHNHLGTAFGGSLSALAILSGYTLLWLELGDRAAHVVVGKSAITYRRPVRGDIRVRCVRPDQMALDAFRETYRSAGKAKIALQSVVEEDGQICVVHEGVYVAVGPPG